jgi:hypothetical protein
LPKDKGINSLCAKKIASGKPALGPVYMEAGLARLARQPGKRDEFLLCLYEKISSRLPGQFCYIDIVLTVVKNSLQRYL